VPENFVRPPSAIYDKIAAESNSVEEMRQKYKALLVSQDVLEIDRGYEWGGKITHEPETASPSPAPESPLAATGSGFKYEKLIRWAESTGKRPLVIRANTLEDLEALERQVTS
jgi:hypothetical protein